jgi:hypothetical protein
MKGNSHSWHVVGGGSKYGSILDNVRYVCGLGLPSLLSLGGIGSTGGRVHLGLRFYPWRMAGMYECGCWGYFCLGALLLRGRGV